MRIFHFLHTSLLECMIRILHNYGAPCTNSSDRTILHCLTHQGSLLSPYMTLKHNCKTWGGLTIPLCMQGHFLFFWSDGMFPRKVGCLMMHSLEASTLSGLPHFHSPNPKPTLEFHSLILVLGMLFIGELYLKWGK